MKDNYFQDEKLKYEDIEIPDELLLMVRRTVAEDRRKKVIKRRAYILKAAGSVAAVLFLCLTIGVNSSYAFAETAVKIPIVKDVAQAVVMRSYRQEIIEVYKENKSRSRTKTEPEATPEKEPEELFTAVSGGDMPEQEETVQKEPQQTAEPAQAEELDGWDAWKAEMTSESLREVTEVYSPDLEELYADTPEKLRTILLAELPEEDVALYGYHGDGAFVGAALRVGDTHQYFDWTYAGESGKLPELFCEDINGDGIKEVSILLYNGKTEMEEISKEEIAAPEGETNKENNLTETEDLKKQKPDEKVTETVTPNSNADNGGSTSKETSVNSTVGTTAVPTAGEKSGEDLSVVSGNDAAEPTRSEEESVQPAGELWVVSPTGETWKAAVLSADDYESQILHRLKADYNAQTGELQLYLTEEVFGSPIKIAVEDPDRQTYEAISFSSERTFAIENGITLMLWPEAVFRRDDGEKISVPLKFELEAEILLEDGTLTVESIQEL